MSQTIESLPKGYKDFLKITLDPYHDSSIRFEGAPTSRNATSVTLCINQEQSYQAADFGIDYIAEPQWDAHFAMYPMFVGHDVLGGVEHDNSTYFVTLQGTGGEYYPRIYPMSVNGVPTGTPTYSVGDYTTSNFRPQGLENGNLCSYVTGSIGGGATTNGPGRRMLRIVGESFEVVDESPDIYAQGAVTVYRYPLDVTPANRLVRHAYDSGVTNSVNPFGPDDPTFLAGVLSRSVNCYDVRSPPTNTSVAVLIPGSKTWKAKEGAYVIGTQYESEVPFKTVDNTNFIFTGYSPSVGTQWPAAGNPIYSWGDVWLKQTYQGGCNTTLADPQYIAGGAVVPPVDAIFPFNLSGAYFTGLSSQYASLRLRYRVYVEILTDPGDNTLAPLGSPTLPYDQLLQEFCMRVIAEQEAGVPQTMNPGGEKWRTVLRTISQVARTAAPLLDQVLPGLGSVAGATGTLLGEVSNVRKAKNKGKPNPTAKASAKASAKQSAKMAPK
jgi:hypothetical protein